MTISKTKKRINKSKKRPPRRKTVTRYFDSSYAVYTYDESCVKQFVESVTPAIRKAVTDIVRGLDKGRPKLMWEGIHVLQRLQQDAVWKVEQRPHRVKGGEASSKHSYGIELAIREVMRKHNKETVPALWNWFERWTDSSHPVKIRPQQSVREGVEYHVYMDGDELFQEEYVLDEGGKIAEKASKMKSIKYRTLEKYVADIKNPSTQ